MSRTSTIKRKTKETDISLFLDIDSTKESKIETPVPFFTHMLDLFSRHGNFHISSQIKGDIEVDFHHTIEDAGIVLGMAFSDALGDKKGIERYGECLLPMDESLAQVALDLSGRPFFKYDILGVNGKIGDFDMEHSKHFFSSFAYNLKATLHINLLCGEDKHHIIESIFKGVAKALFKATRITGSKIPSTKELL